MDKKYFIPPCPDPDKYTLVSSKDGYFWRRKRGTVRPARLNPVFEQNVQASKAAGPAAKHIIQLLQPYLSGIHAGRLTLRLLNALKKAYNVKGKMDFGFLQDMEFLPDSQINLPKELAFVSHKRNIYLYFPKGTSFSMPHPGHYYAIRLICIYSYEGEMQKLESDSHVADQSLANPLLVGLTLPESDFRMILISFSTLDNHKNALGNRFQSLNVVAAS